MSGINETSKIVDLQLRSRLQFDDLEVIAAAASAGLGFAWLPEWLVRERLRSGALISVMEDRVLTTMDVHALWPNALHMPMRLRLAVDALMEDLPKVVAWQTAA